MTLPRFTDDDRRRRLVQRHGLAASHRFDSVESAVSGMTVLHATDQATIYASLAARVANLTVADVDRALYTDRSVVKQMAMRRTLFVFPTELVPAALGSASARVAAQQRPRLVKDLEAAGLPGELWLQNAERAIIELLDDGIDRNTREIRDALPEVAAQVRTNVGKKYEAVVSFAPRVLVQLNVDGLVARGPNDGHWRISRPRWTTMRAWIGDMPPSLGLREGYAELVGRWLRTFGPGTAADLKWWLGSTVGVVRQALDDVGAIPVELDGGGQGWIHAHDVESEQPADPLAVALLPVLDPTVMGWKERDFYLPPPMVPDLFDSVGNAGNTAWVDGRIVGTWIQDDAGVVRVVPHRSVELTAAQRGALDDEARRLTEWFDGVVVNTVWASPAMQVARGELTTS